jgi:hypothetical protein
MTNTFLKYAFFFIVLIGSYSESILGHSLLFFYSVASLKDSLPTADQLMEIALVNPEATESI